MSLVNGNVGIGTDTPAEKLEVDGSIRVGNLKIQPAFAGRIGFNRNTANGAIYDSGYSAVQINGPATSNPNYMAFETYNSSGGNGTTAMVIEEGGNIGIGTTDPDQPLHVVGVRPLRLERAGVGEFEIMIDNTVTGDTGDLVIEPVTGSNSAGFQVRTRNTAGTLIEALNVNHDGAVGVCRDPEGTANLTVQANSGAGAISVVGRSNGGVGGISFYDDNGSTGVGYIQGRADDTQLRFWATQSGGNVSFAQNNTERLRITSYGGVHARNGHLGSAYTVLDSPDRTYWTLSTFNDNAHVTSGTVGIYTSNVEWQPCLIKVTAASVDTDLTDTGSAVWYVRVNGYHGAGNSIGIVDSWTAGSMSISLTATDINQHHMRVNITVTGSGNRTVCSVESLSYGGIFETARTG
tara:strand:- start:439 stop:1659 length:1221 start_codon:yes stop_codon:yes gene_type:complete